MIMKQETIDSVTSYGVGLGATAYALLSDIASIAQMLTMIFGLLLVLVRLAYEARKWWREK